MDPVLHLVLTVLFSAAFIWFVGKFFDSFKK